MKMKFQDRWWFGLAIVGPGRGLGSDPDGPNPPETKARLGEWSRVFLFHPDPSPSRFFHKGDE